MFYDTTIWWTDDNETRDIKKLRKKSNYYETKYKKLSDHQTRINRTLSEVERSYGLTTPATSYVRDDVMRYQYGKAEGDMKKKVSSTIDKIRIKKDVIRRQRESAYDLYIYYYNQAIRG